MSHELGDRHQVDPAAHQLGPEGVAQDVGPERIGAFRVEAGEAAEGLDDLAGIAVADAPTPGVEQQRRRRLGTRPALALTFGGDHDIHPLQPAEHHRR